jgi:hypothetical protein
MPQCVTGSEIVVAPSLDHTPSFFMFEQTLYLATRR